MKQAGELARAFLPLDSEIKAAEQGSPQAKFDLAIAYIAAMPTDTTEEEEYFKQAAHWFHEAAKQGHVEAQDQIGNLYEQGLGVPQSKTEALKWQRKAAEQGLICAETCLSLGNAYFEGQFVLQDYAEAHKWLNIGAALNDKSCQDARDRIAKQMSPEQVAEAQRMARQWKAKRDAR